MSQVDLQTLLDTLREKHKVVGCTAGILSSDSIVSAASGVLNLNTGFACAPDSVFQIGSIGKVFTATLIMQLANDGRLSIDDKVIDHIPEFVIADKKAASSITIRQLLNHTSGMDGDFFPSDDSDGPSTASYVRKMVLLPQIYPPGEGAMTYCNSGYVVAGRIIELRSGTTWQNAVMERICRPLGLAHAFAHPHESLRFASAMGHMADAADRSKMSVAPLTYLPISSAAAGAVLSMSVSDVLRFAQMHISDGELDGKRIVSAARARQMRDDRVPLMPFTRSGCTHWGLGWFVSDGGGYEMVGHDGGTLGHYTYLRVFPQKRLAFSLLTNSPSAALMSEFEEHLMRTLVGAARVPDPPQAPFEVKPERYVGMYANIGARYAIKAEGTSLKLASTLQFDKYEGVLEPYREDVFALRSDRPEYSGQKLLFIGDKGSPAQFLRAGVRMMPRV